jgi:hypothetical protein
MRHPPLSRTPVNISAEIRAQRMNGIFASNFAKEGWEITQQAIEEWTRRHNRQGLLTLGYGGYRWEKLLLRTGTVLRTVAAGIMYRQNQLT